MRTVLFTTLSLAIACTLRSQPGRSMHAQQEQTSSGRSPISDTSLPGKWYMFSRNRLIELSFSGQYMVSKPLTWGLQDFHPGEPPDSTRILRKILAHGNLYLYFHEEKRQDFRQDESTNEKIDITILHWKSSGRTIIMAINGPTGTFPDIRAADVYSAGDTTAKYGVTLYSQKEIERLKDQKNIETMTADDFKRYVGSYTRFRQQLDSLSKLSLPANSLLYYGYAGLRRDIRRSGLQPIDHRPAVRRLP